jgi:hypothetical protein
MARSAFSSCAVAVAATVRSFLWFVPVRAHAGVGEQERDEARVVVRVDRARRA